MLRSSISAPSAAESPRGSATFDGFPGAPADRHVRFWY
jgi:hypothetical protein